MKEKIDLFAPPSREEMLERYAARDKVNQKVKESKDYERYLKDKNKYHFTFTYPQWVEVRREAEERGRALFRGSY